mmetsp:Transcript_8500/g.21063  ORF Transcript_8500/g.21063 Transcript_8500/m.21063 type:complete len:314 (+) Transcript_8500:29-970(+)
MEPLRRAVAAVSVLEAGPLLRWRAAALCSAGPGRLRRALALALPLSGIAGRNGGLARLQWRSRRDLAALPLLRGLPEEPTARLSSGAGAATGEPGGDAGEGEAASDIDAHWMRVAIEEAKEAGEKGEVPVGAVLVSEDGEVVSSAHNSVETSTDPTAHAELKCLRLASAKLRSWRLLGCTLYVTLEPCPMCAGALLQSRVKRVVWGAPNLQLGADGSWIHLLQPIQKNGKGSSNGDSADSFQLRHAGVRGGAAGESANGSGGKHPYHVLEVSRHVLRDECALLLTDFFKKRRSDGVTWSDSTSSSSSSSPERS